MAAQVCTTVSTVLGEGGPLSAIPKLIHQTWRSPHVPERWRAAVRSWKAHHPAWAYRLTGPTPTRGHWSRRRPSLLSKFDAYPYAIPGSRLVLACGPMARGACMALALGRRMVRRVRLVRTLENWPTVWRAARLGRAVPPLRLRGGLVITHAPEDRVRSPARGLPRARVPGRRLLPAGAGRRGRGRRGARRLLRAPAVLSHRASAYTVSSRRLARAPG
jgi:hypothetical protein